jgi:hypothetical protein
LGTISITGTYSGGSPDTIQAAAFPMKPYPGADPAWTTIATPSAGSYSGILQISPGWYRIVVRALTKGMTCGETSILRIGCGEVFIVGGQSNSFAYGSNGTPQIPVNDDVSYFDVSNDWVWGRDAGPNGCVWPLVMDALATYLQMPIAMCLTGVANTSVTVWVSTYYASNIKPAIQFLPANGFRAILWMQGESDSTGSTTQSTYQADLRSIISSSRSDAGFAVPWGICVTETYDNGVPSNTSAIQTAQTAVAGDSGNFVGPNCDAYTSAYRLASPDGVHFNLLGLQAIAPLWVSSIKMAFGW